MSQAKRDQNFVSTGLAISSVDGVTPLLLSVDPVTEWLLVDMSNDSLILTNASKDRRDENFRPTMYGVSSVDGVTLIPIRTDSNGKLLVEH